MSMYKVIIRSMAEMKGVGKIYVFYADVFLLQNLLMDYVAVMGTNFLLKRRRKSRRLFAAALIFSAASLFLVIYIRNPVYYKILTHFFLNTIMVFFCFGASSRKEFLENWMTAYLMVVVLGGVMEWMQESVLLPGNFFVQALFASAVVFSAVVWLGQRKIRQNHIFPVKLKKDERQMELKAYWDSGNQLMDPYTGDAVNILEFARAKEFINTGSERFRYVPYRSLGKEDGLLKVLSIDELVVYQGKKTVRISPAVIGIANEGLMEGKEYGLILHASLLES